MRTKSDELDRRLGRTEHIYWLLDQLYCLNFAAILELEGRLNVTDVQAALDIVQRENPTLRASITTDRLGRPRFNSVTADDYPLMLELHGLRNWRQAIETQLMTPFERGDAPLARFL